MRAGRIQLLATCFTEGEANEGLVQTIIGIVHFLAYYASLHRLYLLGGFPKVEYDGVTFSTYLLQGGIHPIVQKHQTLESNKHSVKALGLFMLEHTYPETAGRLGTFQFQSCYHATNNGVPQAWVLIKYPTFTWPLGQGALPQIHSLSAPSDHVPSSSCWSFSQSILPTAPWQHPHYKRLFVHAPTSVFSATHVPRFV